MTNTKPSSATFEAFFEDSLYLLYKNHLYNFLVRRFMIRRQLKERRFKRILELGCGISPILEAGEGIIQTDFSHRALRHLNAQTRKGTTFRGINCDATRLPFTDEAFDGIICSEVIEHIEEDDKALEEMVRILRQGGELILTCPMHQSHFGFDDELVGHYRRYETDDLQSRLSRCGLKEVKTSPVLGPLEKWIMEPLTRFFASQKKKEAAKNSLSPATRFVAWAALPFYVVFNYLFAIVVYFQAQKVSLDKAVTVCFHYQKRTLN